MTTTPPSTEVMPPPLPCPEVGDPSVVLTPEHLDQLAHAKRQAKKVHRAAAVATTNGYLSAAFSVGSILFVIIGGLFGEIDVAGMIVGTGLAVVAWNEFRGRAMLKCFDVHACRLLGWNQLGLMTLVIGYGAWMIGQALWGPNHYAQQIAEQPMLADTLGPIGELYKTISLAIYGGLIFGTLIFQGLNALYYFTRRKHIEAYLHQTPQWIVEMQKRGIAA